MIYNLIAYFIVILAVGYAFYEVYRFFSNIRKGIYCGSCRSHISYKSLKKLI